MYNSDEWLIRPEWDANDEFAGTKSLARGLLIDAIQKSVLCSDIRYLGSKFSSTPKAIRSLAESRRWLISDGNESPIPRNMCLTVLDIKSQFLLSSILGPLWLRLDKNVCSTLGYGLKRVRGAFFKEKRLSRPGKPGKKKHLQELNMVRDAISVMRETNRMVGVK